MTRAQELRRLIEELKVLRRSTKRAAHSKATLTEAISVITRVLEACERDKGDDFPPPEAFV
jgi:prefoldin subunit 5